MGYVFKDAKVGSRPVQVIEVDSKSDTATAVDAAKKLVKQDKVIAISGPTQIGQIICELKGALTVFLAEQNFNMALNAADYVYVISKGCVAWEGLPEDLRFNEEVKQKWLGV